MALNGVKKAVLIAVLCACRGAIEPTGVKLDAFSSTEIVLLCQLAAMRSGCHPD
jgi:hypothetical protein